MEHQCVKHCDQTFDSVLIAFVVVLFLLLFLWQLLTLLLIRPPHYSDHACQVRRSQTEKDKHFDNHVSLS